MNNPPLLVTGASGHFGRRVIELLLEQNVHPLIVTTRAPEKLSDLKAQGVEVRPADFDKPEELPDAFRGAARALLVSTDAVGTPGQRIAQHQAAIAALERAGVRHVVYTSWLNTERSLAAIAPDHLATEEALAASTLDFTVLRNSIYSEMLLGTLARAIQSGTLVDARPKGTVSYVTREDCARSAAAALVAPTSGRSTLDVTGPDALSSAEVASILSEQVGKAIRHVAVSVEDVVSGMQAAGLPEGLARLYATFETAVENGDVADVSDTVQRLTGRRAQSVREFMGTQRSALGG